MEMRKFLYFCLIALIFSNQFRAMAATDSPQSFMECFRSFDHPDIDRNPAVYDSKSERVLYFTNKNIYAYQITAEQLLKKGVEDRQKILLPAEANRENKEEHGLMYVIKEGSRKGDIIIIPFGGDSKPGDDTLLKPVIDSSKTAHNVVKNYLAKMSFELLSYIHELDKPLEKSKPQIPGADVPVYYDYRRIPEIQEVAIGALKLCQFEGDSEPNKQIKKSLNDAAHYKPKNGLKKITNSN